MYNEVEYNDNDELHIDSDFENYENNKSKYNLVDEFLHYEFDNILDIFYNIKDAFSMSPFFLDHLTITHFSEFVTTLLFKEESKKRCSNSNTKFINTFSSFYNNELHLSHNLINNYLKSFKFTIHFEDWVSFCIVYSNLSELI